MTNPPTAEEREQFAKDFWLLRPLIEGVERAAYERAAQICESWEQSISCGDGMMVVATYPTPEDLAKKIRALAKGEG